MLTICKQYQGVKLGQVLAWKFRVDSEEDHYTQAKAERRQWWIHPGFEIQGQSQPESKKENTSGSPKWKLDTVKKKNTICKNSQWA